MFDSTRADRAQQFIELLPHTIGQWAGQRFVLDPWQRDELIRPLFGTINEAGLRQYRTAYCEIPRKNGKSTLAAAVALYMLFADGEPGAEIYGAAGDKEQATIVFRQAAAMVRATPWLAKRCKIIDSSRRIVVPSTNSFYRAIPAEASTSHGFNAHAIIFDELHTQPNRDLWDVLTTSSGARREPLVFAITTAGFDKHSICWEQHFYAEQIRTGAIPPDPTFFQYVCSAPEDADWLDEAVWRIANPALRSGFRNIEEVRALAFKAAQIPALQNTFRRLYLNQWTAQETRWMDLNAWDANGKPVDPAELYGRPCYAGLDLAATTDLAALVLVFPPQEVGEPYKVLPHFWMPNEDIKGRGDRDRVPYEQWIRQGLITATEGNVIDYDAISAKLEILGQAYRIEEIAFDPWGAYQLAQGLDKAGMTVIPVRQNAQNMSAPTQELMRLVLDHSLAHNGNPVLRWMADNVVVIEDENGLIRPSKKRSPQRIDGIVALIMGLDRAMRQTSHESVYETRGIRTL